MEQRSKNPGRGEETRLRLLEAAADCFAQGGYDATSLQEIVQRAGVAKGTLFYHFANKEQLFQALLDRWMEVLEGQLRQAISVSGSLPEGLARLDALAEEVCRDASGRFQLLLQFWAQAMRDPKVWTASIGHFHRFLDLFAGFIEKGVQEGFLRPVESRSTARVAIGLGMGLLLQVLLDTQQADWPVVLRYGMRLLLEGIQQEVPLETHGPG